MHSYATCVDSWCLCVRALDSNVLVTSSTFHRHANSVQQIDQKPKLFSVHWTKLAASNNSFRAPNRQKPLPRLQPSHLWKPGLLYTSRSLIQHTDIDQKEAAKCQHVSMKNLWQQPVPTFGNWVTSARRVSSRWKCGARWFEENWLEELLLDHMHNPLDPAADLVNRTFQSVKGRGLENSMAKASHAIRNLSNSSTNLNKVKLKQRWSLRGKRKAAGGCWWFCG